MSMVPIPGTNGEFLAVQKFFKMFQWEEAKLVHVKPLADGRYAVTDVLHLPYIHRFDLLPVGDRLYFIGCTLATTKDSREDWSNPGKIFVGEYTGPGPLAGVGAEGRPDAEPRLQPARTRRPRHQPRDLPARCVRGHAAAAARGRLAGAAVHGLAHQRHCRHRYRR